MKVSGNNSSIADRSMIIRKIGFWTEKNVIWIVQWQIAGKSGIM